MADQRELPIFFKEAIAAGVPVVTGERESLHSVTLANSER